MSEVVERFLKYVSFDTQSQEGVETIPSTEKQRVMAQCLAKELETMGACNVRVSKYGYVYAEIPATISEKERHIAKLGFIAHMDTAPSLTGKDVKPKIIYGYEGGDICLNQEQNIYMKVTDFPFLTDYKGCDLITTDGTTLLGGDDKAGIAEIMTMANYFLRHPNVPHGKICIGFTPDEEVGRGAEQFDVVAFGADVAYTVDGGELGEIQYENFNAATAWITVRGVGIHPGSSKNRMINSVLVAMELQSLLPAFDNPMYTEKYEGFFHLEQINGNVEETSMKYLIRDHEMKKFQKKKELICQAVDFLNKKYGEDLIKLEIKDAYFNMKEKLTSHMHLITDVCQVMEELGIVPLIKPVRGGTDGSRLSFMGLPCPNLCTGSRNAHGRYEVACIQAMEKVVQLLIRVVEKQTEVDNGKKFV